MQRVLPHLWFDSNAEEAAHFYVSLFKNSKVKAMSHYGKEGFEIHGRPAGSVLTVAFELAGQEFVALNGGPVFTLNPSISFFANCATEEESDALWEKLSDGGKVLMEYQEYPFSKKYGWLNDKYGLSWQIMLMPSEQKITPSLMFVGKKAGKVEEAIKFYTSIFENSKINMISRYEKGEGDVEGYVKFASFRLAGQEFAAMESTGPHQFDFSPAVSLLVECNDQKELDMYWDKLKEGGDERAQQCGWLADKYGVSWQDAPNGMEEMMKGALTEKTERVMKELLKMKKLDIAALEKAYKG